MERNEMKTMEVPRSRAGLRRAMTMATLAAVLALGGVFGLHPHVAQATPKALAGPTAPARTPDAVGTKADVSAAARASADAVMADDDDDGGDAGDRVSRGGKRVTGKLNLNTATAEQLMMLPGIGPAKAERVVTWRKRNGTFRRVADLRRVKGFGYRTVKKLEPNLDVKGDTTLRAGP